VTILGTTSHSPYEGCIKQYDVGYYTERGRDILCFRNVEYPGLPWKTFAKEFYGKPQEISMAKMLAPFKNYRLDGHYIARPFLTYLPTARENEYYQRRFQSEANKLEVQKASDPTYEEKMQAIEKSMLVIMEEAKIMWDTRDAQERIEREKAYAEYCANKAS
jgi:hypothetical protein